MGIASTRVTPSLLLIVVLTLAASGARAEPPASSLAQAWFERGLVLAREHAWDEARRALLRSLALEPRVSTYFNLAVVSLELQQGRATLQALDEFDRRADPASHRAFLDEAAALRSRALRIVGQLAVTVSPAEAELQLDDETSAPALRHADGIWLDPGSHVLRLRAPNHQEHVLSFRIAAGERRSETVRLRPLPAHEAAAIDTAPARARAPRSRRRRALAWTSAAVVIAGAAAAAIALAVRDDRDRPRGVSGGSTGTVFD